MTGTVAANEVVAVYRDGVKLGNATLVSGSTYQFADNSLVGGTTYSYTTRVEDAAGNRGPESNAFTLTVDTTAPTQLAITEVIDDVEFVTGVITAGGYTNDRTPTVNGTGAESNALITLKDTDGNVLGTATADADGNWSVEPTLANQLADGSYTLQVTQTDTAGNESAPVTFDLNVDATAPTQSTVITGVADDVAPVEGNVANNGYTNDLTPTISGTISAVLAGNEKVVVLRDGVVIGEAVVSGTDWTFADAGLLDGQQYQYTARVEDSSGNRGGDSNSYVINIDSSAPTQTITILTVTDNVDPVQADLPSGSTTNDSTPRLNGTVSAELASNEVIVVYRDGVKVGTATIASGSTSWTYTDGGLSNGTSYTYTARVEDASGQQGPVSNDFALSFVTDGSSNTASITAIVDDVAPVEGTVLNNGYTNDLDPLLQGALTTALAAGETVVVYRNGTEIGTATVSGTSWSYQDSALVTGQNYSYTVAVKNAAGIAGAESTAYVINTDNVAPTQTVTITEVVDNKDPVTGVISNGGVTNDDTPEIKGTLSAILASGEVVIVYRNGIAIGEAVVTGTAWTFADASLGSGETYTYTAQVKDLAGNTSSLSNDYSIVTNFDGASQTTSILRIVDNVDPAQGVIGNNGFTNDTTPTLEGSIGSALNAGDVVVIKRDGVEIGTATVSGTSWTYTDSLSADGSYSYTAVVRNNVGVEGAPSSAYAITLDTVAPESTAVIVDYTDDYAPQTGNFGTGTTTNDTSPTLNISVTGTVAANEVVAVYRDGVKLGNATLVSGSTYQFADNSLVGGTTYSYTTRVEDAAGNRGPESNAFTLTVDTAAPSATATITAITDDTGLSATDFNTSDNTLVIAVTTSATLAADERVQVSLDNGVSWKDAVLVSGSTWSLDNTANELADGTYTFQTRVVDSAGNTGTVSSQVVIIDTTVPSISNVIEITSITDDTGLDATDFITSDTSLTINGTLTGTLGAGEVAQISTDGGTNWTTLTVVAGVWSYVDSRTLTDGEYTYQVRVVDTAGNVGSTDSQIVTVDTTAPSVSNVIEITSITDDTGLDATDFITSDTSLTINGALTGTLGAGEFAQISVDGGTNWTTLTVVAGVWSYVDGRTLTEGEYTYQVRVVDTAGNVGSTDSQIVTVDTTAPSVSNVIEITSVTDDTGLDATDFITSDTSLTINGTLTGTLGAGEVAQISTDGGTNWTTLTVVAGVWSYVDGRTLTEGEYTYQVRVVDTAGNVGSTDSQIVTVDTTAPSSSIEIISITDDTGLDTTDFITSDTSLTINGTLTGTLGAGEVAQISTDGGTNWTTLTVVAGVWSYVDSRTLTDGEYTYQVRVVDTAGNVGSTDSQLVTIDITAPVQTIVIQNYTDNVGVLTGNFGSGTTTDDRTPVLNGTISAGLADDEQVAIYTSANEFVGYAEVSGTSWTYELNGLSDDTTYTYYARVVDHAGNIGSNSNDFSIILDTIPPVVTGLTTTTAITVDTANGVPSSGDTTTLTATNNDLITRDSTPTQISGTLSRTLATGEFLQISVDGGITWKDAALSDDTNWTFVLPETTYTTDATFTVEFRVRDTAGNFAGLTGQDKTVVIDLTSPDGIVNAPIVDSVTTISTSYTFTSAIYGALEAGTTIALINDVNNNGMWQEGLDKVIASAVVAADGSWTITTTLPAGALNLAFLVWDSAGNVSSISSVSSVGVASTSTGAQVVTTTWGGTTDAEGYGINAAAVTISANGTWAFFQSVRGTSGSTTANAGRVYTQDDSLTEYSSVYLAQPSTTNGAGYNVNDAGYGRYLNSVMFADINRDGYVDVMSQVSSYGNAGRTAYWLQNADGTYTPQALNQGTANHLGGAIAYDRTGDGYLDFVMADSAPDSISFIKNDNGTLTYEYNASTNGMPPSGALTIANGLGNNSVTGIAMPTNLSVMHETAAVDLDNNGTVDIVAHVDYNGYTSIQSDTSRGLGVLYNSGTASGFTYVGYANVFAGDAGYDAGNLSQSVTFADFNGDGWLDMYINRGSKAGVDSTESRIYLNDGTGKLLATDANALWFGDSKKGGTSFAVDWNFDGLIDVIEVPTQVTGNYGYTAANNFAPTLYLNTGTNTWGTNATAMTTTLYSDITGAVVVDYDWDGSLDLVLYRAGADAAVVAGDASNPTVLVKNTNIAADGTSLQIRIVDGQGINTYYSNTVKLYNSAGTLVATQLINPQSSGSSNSMGLVSFYGLDPNETYSVQLLRITNGVSDNVGGVSNLGGYTNNTINTSWSGLTTGKANEAYVLTAESDTALTNSANNGVGIVGTGYNDHFFGTLGNDHYNGGGGWIINTEGEKQWVTDGGEDTLDYSLLSAQISVNVSTGTVNKVIDGVTYTDTFENIERFITGSGDTTFTGGSGNDYFVGGQGNDTYNLGGDGGGNDTVYLTLLDAADATGGNGVDVVNGFHIGNVSTDDNADIIDIHELLDGYTGTASLYTDTDGIKLDISASDLLDYLKISSNGTNTTIAIDRDGGGNIFTTVLTLNNVQTDLIELLMNNQIII
ncbi:beta strand repeat-containing protein [Acinetobacter populi]|uniref:beta strand repeat-containing protein n=1 Tax=Acinetobacter populi TaxID=1582270 RepID=UPI001BC8826D|nr:VCBS repeat-containing protein [Acinetobacter populi]